MEKLRVGGYVLREPYLENFEKELAKRRRHLRKKYKHDPNFHKYLKYRLKDLSENAKKIRAIIRGETPKPVSFVAQLEQSLELLKDTPEPELVEIKKGRKFK